MRKLVFTHNNTLTCNATHFWTGWWIETVDQSTWTRSVVKHLLVAREYRFPI